MITLTRRFTSYEIAAQEDRCNLRQPVKIAAKLRESGGSKFQVTVRDIAIAGFSCDAVAAMPVGTRCWITLPGLNSFEAQVIWNDGYHIGCAFAQLLNVAVLDRLIAQHRCPT